MGARLSTPQEEVIVGIVRGEWPVHCFTVEAHAIHWAQDLKAGETKYLWRARLTDLVPVEVVPPPPAMLREAT